jgi:DNA polymerase-3 subunit delta
LLRQELAKAALFVGDAKKIEREQIAIGSADVAEEPIWDLTDAIGGGDAASALALLAKLLRTGSAPQLLLGSLASHFRRLLRVRSGGEVAGPPFVRKKLEGQARRYSPARLEGALRAIHDTDRALKGEGSVPPDLALERLVLGLL